MKMKQALDLISQAHFIDFSEAEFEQHANCTSDSPRYAYIERDSGVNVVIIEDGDSYEFSLYRYNPESGYDEETPFVQYQMTFAKVTAS